MAKRHTFTAEFKAQVVLEMLTEQKSAAQAQKAVDFLLSTQFNDPQVIHQVYINLNVV